MRMKQFVFRLILAFISVSLLLTVIELMMRLAPRQDNIVEQLLGEREFNFLSMQSSRAHPWSQGCPDPLKIGIVGDSFTTGVGVQLFDRYANRLELMLNLNDGVRPAEVRIFAEAGTSTRQQLPLLEEALAWKPQIIILGICLNDAEDTSNTRELMQWRKDFMPQPPPALLGKILRHSRVLSWIYMKKENSKNRLGFIEYYQKLYNSEYAGYKKFTEAIGDMKAKCDAGKTVLIAAVFPLLSYSMEENKYPFEFIHKQISEVLKSRNILCLDMHEKFYMTDPKRMQVLPGVDPHPDEIAHQIIAEGMLYYLVDNGLIDKSYQPKLREQTLHNKWKKLAKHMLDPLDEKEAEQKAPADKP